MLATLGLSMKQRAHMLETAGRRGSIVEGGPQVTLRAMRAVLGTAGPRS